MQGETENKDESFQTFCDTDMGMHAREAARLEIGKHIFNTPAKAVIPRFVLSGRAVHGDIPRLWVPFFMEEAIGNHPRTETKLFAKRDTLLSHLVKGLVIARLLEHAQVAFKTQTITPSLPLAPRD